MSGSELAISLVLGAIASIAGGALGGILIGGKHIGNELAAMMGSFYGPIGGGAGVLAGLIFYKLIGI